MGRIVYDMSDEEYHKLQDKDHHYSSSQLKDALDDIRLFYNKYIAKTVPKEESAAFEIGKYFHMSILENEKVHAASAVWMGDRRAGKAWEEFKVANAGKIILTGTEFEKAGTLIKATRGNSVLMGLLEHPLAKSEVSVFTKLLGVPIKVRFDSLVIDPDAGMAYTVDLKSTTGNPSNEHEIKNKISAYQYDLSAALYMDAINQHFKEIGSKIRMNDFYLGFASKDMEYGTSQVYRVSDENIKIGRAKYTKALANILDAQKRGWLFQPDIRELQPHDFERRWLPVEVTEKRTSKVSTKEKPKQEEGVDCL